MYSGKTKRRKTTPLLFKRTDFTLDFVKAKLIFMRQKKYQFGIKIRGAAVPMRQNGE